MSLSFRALDDFSHAVEIGNVPGVANGLKVLGKGVLVQSSGPTMDMPLQTAARFGHTLMVELLLEAQAWVGGTDTSAQSSERKYLSDRSIMVAQNQKEDMRALLRAAESGNTLETVQAFGALGPPRYCINRNGDYPIHTAAGAGHIAVVDLLLGARARIDTQTAAGPQGELGDQAIHIAACSRDVKMVRHLLSLQASVNAVNARYSYPLNMAAACGGGAEVVRELLDSRASTDCGTYFRSPLLDAVSACNLSAIQLMIGYGFSIPDKSFELQCVLLDAGKRSFYPLMLLLTSVASILDKKEQGKSLYQAQQYEAAADKYRHGATEAAVIDFQCLRSVLLSNLSQCQLKLGQFSDSVTTCWQALNMEPPTAVRTKLLQRMEELKGESVSPNAAAVGDCSDLTYTLRLNSRMLSNTLVEATIDGNTELVVSILERHEPQLYLPMVWNNSLVLLAGDFGHESTAHCLIDRRAIIGANHPCHQSMLHIAAGAGGHDVTLTLLRHLAAVDRKDGEGWQPLHCAARHGHKHIAELLLEHRAQANATNDFKLVPLHYAAAWGHKSVTCTLIAHGACIDSLDRDGCCPSDASYQNRQYSFAMWFDLVSRILPIKDRAKELYSQQKYHEALQSYREAYFHARVLESGSFSAVLLANLAQCELQLHMNNECLETCGRALSMRPPKQVFDKIICRIKKASHASNCSGYEVLAMVCGTQCLKDVSSGACAAQSSDFPLRVLVSISTHLPIIRRVMDIPKSADAILHSISTSQPLCNSLEEVLSIENDRLDNIFAALDSVVQKSRNASAGWEEFWGEQEWIHLAVVSTTSVCDAVIKRRNHARAIAVDRANDFLMCMAEVQPAFESLESFKLDLARRLTSGADVANTAAMFQELGLTDCASSASAATAQEAPLEAANEISGRFVARLVDMRTEFSSEARARMTSMEAATRDCFCQSFTTCQAMIPAYLEQHLVAIETGEMQCLRARNQLAQLVCTACNVLNEQRQMAVRVRGWALFLESLIQEGQRAGLTIIHETHEALREARKRLKFARRDQEDAIEEGDANATDEAKDSVRKAKVELQTKSHEFGLAIANGWRHCEKCLPELRSELEVYTNNNVTDACRKLGKRGGTVLQRLCARSFGDYDEAHGCGSDAPQRIAFMTFQGRKCALKRFELSHAFSLPSFVAEVSLHTRLHHRNIIPLCEAFVDGYAGFLHFHFYPSNADDWCHHGMPVVAGHRPLMADTIQKVLQGMVHAVYYVHGIGVAHGDIKPSNYLLTEDEIPLLTDFELARDASRTTDTSETTTTTVAIQGGTLRFLAPELCFPLESTHGVVVRDPSKRISFPSDVYALGCTIQDILDGPAVAKAFGSASAGTEWVHIAHAMSKHVSAERPHLADVVQHKFLSVQLEDPAEEKAGRSTPPPYWLNIDLVDGVQLHSSRFMLQEVRKLLHRMDHCNVFDVWKVVDVKRIENTWLWREYFTKTQLIAAKHARLGTTVQPLPLKHFPTSSCLGTSLNLELNEVFLLHGCSPRTVDIIAYSGFDERVADPRGLYGGGLYFTPQSCKALQYSRADDCTVYSKRCGKFWCECDGERQMILARVLVGDAYVTDRQLKGHRRPPLRNDRTSETFDAVVALPGVANGGKQEHTEVVMFDRGQIYPEFVVKLAYSP